MPDPVEITLGNITEVIVEVSSAIAISGGNGTGNGTTQYGNLTIGNVTTGNAGTNANASITGTAPNQILNLTIPRGDTGQTGATGSTGSTGATGPAGPANNLTISSVTTGNAGTSASVTISGTSPNQALSFTIPRGDVGATGATGSTGPQGPAGSAGSAGAAATITVGTTTTGAAGTSASVTNSGTSSAAVFNFTIPQGAAGATGATGAAGAAGPNTVTTSTTTTITGLIKGTGSVIAQAVAGTDYVTPGSLSAVATSGSATDLTTGTLANARLASSVLRNDQGVACNDQVISRFAGNTIAVTGSLTLSATHNGAVLVSTSATALNITVPTGLPTGFNCTIVQDGAGQVTVVASSTTINGRNGLKTAAQHAVIAIVPTTTANAYKVTGDTAV